MPLSVVVENKTCMVYLFVPDFSVYQTELHIPVWLLSFKKKGTARIVIYLHKYVIFENPKEDEIAIMQDLMFTVYIYQKTGKYTQACRRGIGAEHLTIVTNAEFGP